MDGSWSEVNSNPCSLGPLTHNWSPKADTCLERSPASKGDLWLLPQRNGPILGALPQPYASLTSPLVRRMAPKAAILGEV